MTTRALHEHDDELARVLALSAWSSVASAARLLALGAALFFVLNYSGLFDLARFRDAAPTIATLLSESTPPDFSRWRNWIAPLFDTVAMSVSGTFLAALLSLCLAPFVAANTSSLWTRLPLRLAMNAMRSIPAVVWGIVFVAAVGFGPLPGALALACHSTGMLGKLYSETLEHVEPGPGLALRSQGVSYFGVLRFAVFPQIFPRLVDVTLYRLEHNVHAATVMGLVGAGGLGLEVTTAFHLFEYREAFALILVLLALVTLINFVGAMLRAHLLGRENP